MGLNWGRALLACGVLSAAAIGTWACSQGDPQPGLIPDPPKQDSSTTQGDGGGGDASKVVCLSDDGGCNTLANCGSKIYIIQEPQSGPTAQGGTVLDGKYVLTDYRVFTGTGGSSGVTSAYFSETMTLVTSVDDGGANDASSDGGTTQEMLWEDNTASNTTPLSSSSSGIADFNGTNIVITHTCPNTNSFSATFTMSNTQLLFFVQDSTGTGQLTYTKQ
jgi:hypothetical protein